jgi:hypothetical protein
MTPFLLNGTEESKCLDILQVRCPFIVSAQFDFFLRRDAEEEKLRKLKFLLSNISQPKSDLSLWHDQIMRSGAVE